MARAASLGSKHKYVNDQPEFMPKDSELSSPFLRWPTDIDASLALLNTLDLVTSGVNGLTECLGIAANIDPRSRESWLTTWRAHARRRKEQALLAENARRYATARTNWWLAACYFLASQAFLEFADVRREAAIGQVRECTSRTLTGDNCAGSVTIHDEDIGELRALLSSGRKGDSDGAPAIIAVGGADDLKEEAFLRLQPRAEQRGITLLSIELPGNRSNGFARSESDLASIVIDRWIDFLMSRTDLALGRVGVLGLGLGAGFASEAAYLPRVTAVAGDGGRTRAFRSGAIMSAVDGWRPAQLADQGDAERPNPPCRALVIQEDDVCPAQVRLAEAITGGDVRDVFRQLAQNSPMLANDAFDYILDWFADKLTVPAYRLDLDSKLGS